MVVLPFISSTHHPICSSFGLKCHKTHLIQSLWKAQGLLKTESTVLKSYIDMNTFYTLFEDHFCTQDGLRTKENISLDFGPNIHGKGIWEVVREEELSSKNTLKLFRSIFFFLEKKWKAAEGKDLLNFSFPLFWKGCSKRWPVIRQQRIHVEEGHGEHPKQKGSHLLFRADLLQGCRETKA